MSIRRKATLPLIVAVCATCCAAVGAWEDLPVCAVIELDQNGGLWINGDPGDLDSSTLSECGEWSTFVLAPDSSASAGAFVTIASRVLGLQHPTRYLLPSSRREIEELFGFDSLAKCETFSRRTIETLPSGSMGDDAVSVVRVDGHITALEVAATTSLGAVDEVAWSSGAYSQPDGVRIVVKSGSQETEVRIREDQFYVPPPPVIGISAHHACIYPESAKE